MESHVFNQQTKRLDPIDNKCMCCGKGISHGEKDNYYISLYKPQNWERGLFYYSVEYKKINVGVARCESCKQIHKKALLNSLLFSLGIGLVLAIVGLLFFFVWDMRALGWIFIVLGVIAAALIVLSKGVDWEAAYLEKKGVLPKEHAVQKYEEIAELVRQGWSFERPMMQRWPFTSM